MALRDELFSIDDLVNASQGFLSSTEAVRKNAARSALGKAVQTGEENPLRLAGLAFEAGDPTALREVIQNKTKPQTATKPGEGAFSPQQLKTIAAGLGANITDDQAEALAQTDQKTALSGLRGIQQGKQFAYSEARRDESLSLSKSKEQVGQLSAFEKDFESRLKKRKESIESIDQLMQLADQDIAAVDRVLLTNTAKTLGKDVGNIAVQEAQQILPRTAFKDWASVVNYVSNTANTQIPPEVKQELVQIFALANKFQKSKLQDEAAKNFEAIGNAKRQRLVRNGKLDPSGLAVASRYGIDVEVDPNGVIKAMPGEGKVSVGKNGPETPANSKKGKLLKMANSIPDEKMRQNALSAINATAEDALSDALASQFEALIKQNGGK